MNWTADITNDPDREQKLYIELLEADEYRGRVYRRDDGLLVLAVYGASETEIPLNWLTEVARGAARDL